MKYKEIAEKEKLNCVYPSIVGVKKPETKKITKLKLFQYSGKI